MGSLVNSALKINMIKELAFLSLFVVLLSTVESNKNVKNILKTVREIKKKMVVSDEMEEFKEQISVELAEVKQALDSCYSTYSVGYNPTEDTFTDVLYQVNNITKMDIYYDTLGIAG